MAIPNKKVYNINIPANIFQTWNNKKLPPKMYYIMKQMKQNNPNFRFYLFDDNDCRKFIKSNFDSNILNTYIFICRMCALFARMTLQVTHSKM